MGLPHFFSITFRSFFRHKSSFLINLSGLSIGLACAILIILWVRDEQQMDQFHANHQNIYKVLENQTYSDGMFTTQSTPGLLAEALKNDFPEVELAATVTWNQKMQLTKGDNALRVEGKYADPDFISIFSFPLLHGDKSTALNDPKSIVITKSVAEKLFNKLDVVGEDIEVLRDKKYSYRISAVLDNIPQNSSLQFDFLIPFDVFRSANDWVNRWGNNGPRTYISLTAGSSEEDTEAKIRDFVLKHNEDSNVVLHLHRFSDYYLYGEYNNGKPDGGRITSVRIFQLLAVFILLLACINFMNLSTAKSSRRAKEVGIRKTLGADRRALMLQFLGESILIAFLALGIAIIFTVVALPYFNDLTDKSIVLDLTNPSLSGLLFVIVFFTGLISGSYPAVFLSSFVPVKVLKGLFRQSGGEAFIRKGLVVFQYALSVFLIIATLVIYLQLDYVQSKSLGYDKENIIFFPNEGSIREGHESFFNDLKKLPAVESVALSTHNFLERNSNTSGINWPGKDPTQSILFEMVGADENLQSVMKFELVEGRFFSSDFGNDSTHVVINEQAQKVMGLEDPVGTTLTDWANRRVSIIGVIKDFHYESMRSQLAPMIMRYEPRYSGSIMIRLNSGNIKQNIEQIAAIYEQHNPGYLLEYKFLDKEYQNLYDREIRMGKLSTYFASLAIIISCMGLFGLSIFTAERRTKEIGIRKALGATMTNIVLLLNKEFTRLVLLGIVISLPVSYWAMHKWLTDFEYRIDFSLWILAVGGGLTLLIAWFTVSFQSVKAAHANPADSLHVDD